MSENNPDFDLNEKIHQEKQLIAEQKWILDALKKIKNQRNALQIERMQLENMKREFIKENSLNQKGQPLKKASDIPTGVTGVPPSDQKLVSEMASLATPGPSTAAPGPKPGPSTAGSAIDQFLELEATCNNEVLNLKVAKPLLSFSKRKFSESEEEEDEDDEINVIDMNMLINMNCSRKE